MMLTCPQCGMHWKISKPASADAVQAAKCRACGEQIPLSENTSRPQAAGHDLIEVTCRKCGKLYRIPASRIQPAKTRARAKVCGASIALSPWLKAGASRPPDRPAPALKRLPPKHPRVTAPEQADRSALPAPPKRLGLRIALVSAGLVFMTAMLACQFAPNNTSKPR